MTGTIRQTGKLLLPAALAASLALLGGCVTRVDNYLTDSPWGRSRDLRLYEFRNMEKLLVAPFHDESRTQYLKPHAEHFAESLASQLVRFRRFRMLYPDEFERAAEAVRARYAARREKAIAERAAAAAAAEALAPAERERALARLAQRFPAPKSLPIEGSEEFLVLVAQEAGADGVVVVQVKDFTPYMPKRVAVRMRVYGTANLVMSGPDVLSMTDDGIPLDVPFTLRDRFIWEYEQLFDAHNKPTQLAIAAHARAHDRSAHPYGHRIFLNSSEKFLEFVADHLASRLARDAGKHKQLRGKIERAARDRARRERSAAAGAIPTYD